MYCGRFIMLCAGGELMKKITPCLIIIFFLLTFSFVGCSNNTDKSRISLTTENYHNWLSQNLYISDFQMMSSQDDNITYTLSCTLNIETVKTIDVHFENVTITYSCPKIQQWSCSDFQTSIRVSYDGESHASFVLTSKDRMIIDAPSLSAFTLEVAEISGYVIISV